MMKNFNKVVGSLLMSGVLLAGVGVNASADTTGSGASSSSATANTTGTTDISATFTKSTQTVTPVDPNNPDKPSDKGDGGNGAHAGGDLSLIYVSNKLDFGKHEIDVLNSSTYTAQNITSDVSGLWNGKDIIEVSDVRGSNAGWTLSVSGGTLTGTDGDTIKGATLALPQGTVSNSGSDSNGATSTAADNVLDNTSATVLGAGKDKGAGVTVDQLDPAEIKLTIPANTTKAQAYSTTLNWSLSDTPAS